MKRMKKLLLYLAVGFAVVESVMSESFSRSCTCVNGVCTCESSEDETGNIAGSAGFATTGFGTGSSTFNSAGTGSTSTNTVTINTSGTGDQIFPDYNPIKDGVLFPAVFPFGGGFQHSSTYSSDGTDSTSTKTVAISTSGTGDNLSQDNNPINEGVPLPAVLPFGGGFQQSSTHSSDGTGTTTTTKTVTISTSGTDDNVPSDYNPMKDGVPFPAVFPFSGGFPFVPVIGVGPFGGFGSFGGVGGPKRFGGASAFGGAFAAAGKKRK